jgi:signal transduction histidine kinase
MHFERRLLDHLWAVAGLLVVAMMVATSLLLQTERADALANGQARVTRFVDGAEAAFNRSFMGVDALLAGLAVHLGEEGTQALATHELHQSLRQNLLLHDLVFLDAQGRVLAAGQDSTQRAGLQLPAGFLQEVLAQAAPAMVISVPATDSTSAESVLFLGRPLQWLGQPALLVAEVPVSLVASILSQSVDVDGLSVSLERRDGQLLASAPAALRVNGDRIALAPLEAASANGQAWQAPGRLDGAPALVASRPTLYPGVMLAASLRVDAALRDIDKRRSIILAASGGFILTLLGAAGLGHAYLRRMGRTQADLAASKATLEQALAAMGDGFVLWDAHHRVVAWNHRYLELFPWLRDVIAVGATARSLGEVAARVTMPHATEQERQDWMAWRHSVRERGQGAFSQVAANGLTVDTIERRTSDGGMVSLHRDVTAQERELAAAKVAADSANEAKTRFLATMSHEMRTPLNGVLGMIGLLLAGPLNPTQRHQAELIRRSGNTLLSVLNDVLDLSKIEAGRMDLEVLPFRLVDAVQEVISLMEVRALPKQLMLKLVLAPDLPPVLCGDASRLRQVLFNLVGNALKFTERGGVVVSLSVHDTPDAAWPGDDIDPKVNLMITVQDTGIGIPADALPRLFARFSQADTSTARRYGGTGLGLAISKEIVGLMGGSITVQSIEGQGSCFTVVLPMAEGKLPEPTPAAPGAALAAMGDGTGARRLRVLAAEDNAVNQILIKTLVEHLGHQCDLVATGVEAMQQVQVAQYDLVLMDIQMPEMDGTVATQRIRALPGAVGRLPILAMTANVSREQQAGYLAVGMNGVVPKPIEPDQLARAIRLAMALAPEAEAEAAQPR